MSKMEIKDVFFIQEKWTYKHGDKNAGEMRDVAATIRAGACGVTHNDTRTGEAKGFVKISATGAE